MEVLLGEIEALAEPARTHVFQLLDGIDALHRGALHQLADDLGVDVLARAREAHPAVAWLLDAYGVGVDERAAAEQALEPILPYVHSHGGRVLIAPPTSSAGRLFDAVAALLGVRDRINYEGQAAVELEQRADPGEAGAYDVGFDAAGLVRAVVADLAAGVDVPVIAARFHRGLAAGVAAACTSARDRTGLAAVALSGGVFQNLLLLARTVDLLEQRGFTVLTHRRVPPNDGGISLGQAAVAGAVDRADEAAGG